VGVVSTFIVVVAGDSIATETRVASASESAISVGAGSTIITVVGFGGAFVVVSACYSIAAVA
jgi:hypothetical protein